MPQFNRYTESAIKLGERWGTAALRAEKSKTIPFGEAKLTAAEQRQRDAEMLPGEVTSMSPEERRSFIERVGTDAALNVIRKGRGA